MSNHTGPRQPTPDADERARTLYWGELIQLKIDAQYVQRYYDRITAILTTVDVVRAVISVGALGSWVAGFGYPKVWASIIVASQVAEAVLAKLPLTARQKGLSGFGNALDAMLIDALLEWEDIQAEQVDGATQITRRWHTLMKLKNEAERANLPSGLPVNKNLFKLAELDAASYIESRYTTRRV